MENTNPVVYYEGLTAHLKCKLYCYKVYYTLYITDLTFHSQLIIFFQLKLLSFDQNFFASIYGYSLNVQLIFFLLIYASFNHYVYFLTLHVILFSTQTSVHYGNVFHAQLVSINMMVMDVELVSVS